MKMYKYLKNESGTVLLWSTLYITLFFLVIGTVTTILISEIKQTRQLDSSVEAYMAAESGEERARNYASANPGQAVTKTGQKVAVSSDQELANVTYDFQVGGSGSPYDSSVSPARTCVDWQYCYYSEGKVGNIRRKIDGGVSDDGYVSKWTNLYNSATTITNNEIDLTTSPDPPSISISATAKYIIFSGDISGIDPTSVKHYHLGFVDPTNQGSQTGVSLDIYQGKIYLNRATAASSGTLNTAGTLVTIDLRNNSAIKFVITYRKESTNSTFSLKVTDANDDCLDIQTASYNPDIVPRALFLPTTVGPTTLSSSIGSGPDPANDSSKFVVQTNTGSSIYLKNLYIKADAATELPQYTLNINKSGCPTCTVTASPASSTGKYDEGTSVTITYTKPAGYGFDGWTGDCTGTGACSVIMNADKTVNASFVSNTMYSGEVLYAGNYRISENGQYKLIYQADGKLELYRIGNTTPLWSSPASPSGTAGFAVMQTDANLVLYTPAGYYWASGICCFTRNDYLRVMDTGTVGTYRGDTGANTWIKP